eukprot:CAMPEP_0117576062 /NCGR_PEP_ID=MMETSP0784-20121206/62578_1 /TAXON_ID=39447 /ORGANISM="" /LENGTH=466 /DNA_ID=CAMNT_0005375251 /DNA_START=46 /DNA_END=1443 /DNA_ORIENTATION=-
MARTSVFPVLLSLWHTSSAVYQVSEWTSVFAAGEADMNGVKYSCFRIPVLVRSKTGKLFAFGEGRRDNSRSIHPCMDQGDVQIMVRSSDDDGKTWGVMRKVVEMPGHTAGNPVAIYSGGNSTKGGSSACAPALHVVFSRDNRECFTTMSMDDGVTWSTPVSRAAALQPGVGKFMATGPGGGLELASGRLVASMYYAGAAYAIWSDDCGKNWERGANLPHRFEQVEPQLTLLSDGRLVMMARTAPRAPDPDVRQHHIGISSDEGATWSVINPYENVPGVKCQASILATPHALVQSTARGPPPQLNTCPDRRCNMEVYATSDSVGDGNLSWHRYAILYRGNGAYSSMIPSLEPGWISILIERGDGAFHTPYTGPFTNPMLSGGTTTLYRDLSYSRFPAPGTDGATALDDAEAAPLALWSRGVQKDAPQGLRLDSMSLGTAAFASLVVAAGALALHRRSSHSWSGMQPL